MNESFYLGAYWPARQEPLEGCVDRLAKCLQGLRRHALLAQWFRRGYSRASARTPVAVDAQSLGELLRAGVNRRDQDGAVIDELGFSCGVWNGDDLDPVSLMLCCGLTARVSGLVNALVLDLPELSKRSAELYSRAGSTDLMTVVAEAWLPDWATITSHSLREALSPPPGAPVLGWITYLSRARWSGSVLACPYVLQRVGDLGTLIIVGDNPLAVDSSALAVLAQALGPEALRPLA